MENSTISPNRCHSCKLQALNTTSIELLHSLTNELEDIKKRLLEIQSLQNQYLDAFEQKTLPVTILQERLQKLTAEKTALEQRQNEITAQLSSNDSKVIPVSSHYLLKYT